MINLATMSKYLRGELRHCENKMQEDHVCKFWLEKAYLMGVEEYVVPLARALEPIIDSSLRKSK